jgi:hypothetical protein
MGTKLTEGVLENLLSLRSQGLTNRQIATELGVHHRTIANWLKREGLFSARKTPLDVIDEHNARCKHCEVVLPLDEFQYGRKGRPDEYRYAFCNRCRRNRRRIIINADITHVLKERVRQTKIRSQKIGIPFNLGWVDLMKCWESQQGLCFYTDVPMEWNVGKGLSGRSMSVDKLIPELGYVPGNVVLCTQRANTIKNNLNFEELKTWIPSWHERITNRS